MRFLTVRRLAVAALLPALLVVTVVPGCSNESEGERCGDDFGGVNDADCSSPLVCIASEMLLNSSGADRCCYPDATQVTDTRCTRATNANTSSGGSGGTANAADASTDSGSSDAATGGADSGGTAGSTGTATAGAADAAGAGGS